MAYEHPSYSKFEIKKVPLDTARAALVEHLKHRPHHSDIAARTKWALQKEMLETAIHAHNTNVWKEVT